MTLHAEKNEHWIVQEDNDQKHPIVSTQTGSRKMAKMLVEKAKLRCLKIYWVMLAQTVSWDFFFGFLIGIGPSIGLPLENGCCVLLRMKSTMISKSPNWRQRWVFPLQRPQFIKGVISVMLPLEPNPVYTLYHDLHTKKHKIKPSFAWASLTAPTISASVAKPYAKYREAPKVSCIPFPMIELRLFVGEEFFYLLKFCHSSVQKCREITSHLYARKELDKHWILHFSIWLLPGHFDHHAVVLEKRFPNSTRGLHLPLITHSGRLPQNLFKDWFPL